MLVLYLAVAVSDLQDPSDLVGWLRCSSLRSQERVPHSVRRPSSAAPHTATQYSGLLAARLTSVWQPPYSC